ncbi:hypothetical protein [Luteolibacter sp. LG18]|uniref:hypothetical protein n=1 Tax=Luteolibacter sp. LG18 TaxID=2819286 RepID=UPI002B320DAB|nr:hypothetical protein llg_05730 [Luteolibacter sp. LG18]
MKRLLPLAVLPLFLSHCAPTVPAEADEVAQRFTSGIRADNEPPAPDTSGIRVPILRASAWGAPRYTVMKDGSYIARYKHGTDTLDIVGTSRPVKRESFDYPGTVTVMGRQLATYDSGNEDPELTTEPFSLTAPDGRTATYCLVLGGAQGGLAKRVPVVGW